MNETFCHRRLYPRRAVAEKRCVPSTLLTQPTHPCCPPPVSSLAFASFVSHCSSRVLAFVPTCSASVSLLQAGPSSRLASSASGFLYHAPPLAPLAAAAAAASWHPFCARCVFCLCSPRCRLTACKHCSLRAKGGPAGLHGVAVTQHADSCLAWFAVLQLTAVGHGLVS